MTQPPLHQIEPDKPATIRLREDEQALVEEECALLLSQSLAPQAAQLYQTLLIAVQESEVPQELEEALQALLEVGMESGRIRAVHGAHAEMAATRLYARLPRGKVYTQSVTSANEALKSLEGQPLVDATFQAAGPGSCKLIVDTGSRRITIRIKRGGLS
ncbi:MAG: hypothetical protein M3Y56_04750, partial [Armatimonadota bacterium]|nr:hypothetical protein [Armatimonadota bacterium]